jgi:hypothetical protein
MTAARAIRIAVATASRIQKWRDQLVFVVSGIA